MSAVATSALPTSKAVRDMFEELLGRDVTVAPCEPVVPSPKAPGAVAVYVDARLRTGAVAVTDMALSAYAGAAIGLVPPGGAKACLEDGALSPVVFENLYEVLNIFASLFNQPGAKHLKLYKVYGPDELPPADVSAYVRTLGRRLDLGVTVGGYGSGRLGVVAL
ncbi:hypothetical protein [Vallicoccus soli]|uniref:Uncharacterized protein n=1 Tax=Vallicoccus soli TaxID=2339232 RepID=A0A3A3YP27_9ACTN|nr:hypothetical protein [Vallicoccus soli]RJK92453.1 hypothetical protein D5H78_18930 [Vallicoccus soli]